MVSYKFHLHCPPCPLAVNAVGGSIYWRYWTSVNKPRKPRIQTKFLISPSVIYGQHMRCGSSTLCLHSGLPRCPFVAYYNCLKCLNSKGVIWINPLTYSRLTLLVTVTAYTGYLILETQGQDTQCVDWLRPDWVRAAAIVLVSDQVIKLG